MVSPYETPQKTSLFAKSRSLARTLALIAEVEARSWIAPVWTTIVLLTPEESKRHEIAKGFYRRNLFAHRRAISKLAGELHGS